MTDTLSDRERELLEAAMEIAVKLEAWRAARQAIFDVRDGDRTDMRPLFTVLGNAENDLMNAARADINNLSAPRGQSTGGNTA